MKAKKKGSILDWARFNNGGHPDYVDSDSLDIHVIWCVWHEGIPAYRYEGQINSFRSACVDKQQHNSYARNRIKNATNNEIVVVLSRMSEYFDNSKNGGYKMLEHHLGWVCSHQGRRAELLTLLDAGSFALIRAIYRSEQSHNPHVHYLIDAATDGTVRSILNDQRRKAVKDTKRGQAGAS